MMKTFNTSDLRGNALRAAVALAASIGMEPGEYPETLDFSAIADREGITVSEGFGAWVANHKGYGPLSAVSEKGNTKIQAAMRCFVKFKFGSFVELPLAKG